MESLKIESVHFDVSPFQVMQLSNGKVHLTTSHFIYDHYPELFAPGGITAAIKPDLGPLLNGKFIFTQICTYHKLNIVKNNIDISPFECKSKMKDTSSPSEDYYAIITVNNGNLGFSSWTNLDFSGVAKPSELRFKDILFLELLDDWNRVEYIVKFDTYLSFKNLDSDIIAPLLKFSWYNEAIITKDNGGWVMLHEKHSNADEVKSALVFFEEASDVDTRLITPSNMNQLHLAVMEYRAKHGLLPN